MEEEIVSLVQIQLFNNLIATLGMRVNALRVLTEEMSIP